MDWAEIVTAVVSKSAGATAGTAVAPGGPIAIAAADAAAEQAMSALTDTVLNEFRAAQHEQTQQLLAANDQCRAA